MCLLRLIDFGSVAKTILFLFLINNSSVCGV